MTDDEKSLRAREAYFERGRREKAEILAAAKAEALRLGKEQFDLDKVKRLWVVHRPPEESPGPDELGSLEYAYYTTPWVRTNEEFAKLLSDNEFWR